MQEEVLETQSGKTDPLLERLQVSLQIQRFLSRVLNEAVHLGSDSIQLRADAQVLSVNILAEKKILKTTTLKASWFMPIVGWLAERVSWSSPRQPPPDLTSMSYSFHAAVRDRETVSRFKVSRENGLNKARELIIDELVSRSVKSVLDELEVTQPGFEKLLSYESGVLVLVNPASKPLVTSLAPVLSLSFGHYAGQISSGIDSGSIADFAKSNLVIMSTPGDDATEGLLKVRDWARDPRPLLLRGAVAQGAVKRVCPSCGRAAPLSTDSLKAIPESIRPKGSYTYLVGRGCARCSDSGYLGTILVQSVAEVDSAVLAALHDGVGQEPLLELLYPKGTRSLFEDGAHKCLRGRTTFEALFPLVQSLPGAYSAVMSKAQPEEPDSLSDMRGDFFESKDGSSPKPLLGRGAYTGNPSDSLIEDGPLFGSVRAKKREKPLVLIVEDDKDQRSILDMVLRSADYDVELACDGVEALEKAGQECPDLVITDLMMPNMDGSVLVTTMRADPRFQNLPILVLTVLNDTDKEYKLLDLGADEYCEKTIQRKLLLKRVQNLLKRKER